MIIAIVILVIFLASLTVANVCKYEDYLYGFWVAEDDDFTDDSEISSMMFFIGRSMGWFRKERQCYLVIMNDICSQGVTIKYLRGWASPIHGKYRIYCTVKCDVTPIWPTDITIDIDTLNGTMKIHNKGTLLAMLHKNHEITNSARAAEKAKLT